MKARRIATQRQALLRSASAYGKPTSVSDYAPGGAAQADVGIDAVHIAIEPSAFAIAGAPHVHLLSRKGDHHFIKMPTLRHAGVPIVAGVEIGKPSTALTTSWLSMA
jgi:hypothetical protein